MRQHAFKVFEAGLTDAGENVLGERLAALLQEGGLTSEQAEQIRAELEKVGFVAFRRLRGRERLADIAPATVSRLMLEAKDRIDRPEVRQAYETCLYLRKAWRTDLSDMGEATRV